MPQTKEEALAEAQRKFEEEKARIEREAAITAALPESVFAYKVRCSIHETYTKARVAIEGVPLDKVAALMETLPPLDLSRVKGTFLSFKPTALLTDKDTEHNDITHIAPFVLTLNQWGSKHGPSYHKVEVTWFTRLTDDMMAMVEVSLDPLPWRIEECHQRDRDNRITHYEWRLPWLLQQKARESGVFKMGQYSSGSHDTPGEFYLIWPIDRDWSDFMAVVNEPLTAQ
jgi:hypothetical protein